MSNMEMVCFIFMRKSKTGDLLINHRFLVQCDPCKILNVNSIPQKNTIQTLCSLVILFDCFGEKRFYFTLIRGT